MGSRFDAACRDAERFPSRLGTLKDFLREAALFEFESEHADVSVEDIPDEMMFLPFQKVALEFPHGLLLMADPKENISGKYVRRMFVTVDRTQDYLAQNWDKHSPFSNWLVGHVAGDPEVPGGLSVGIDEQIIVTGDDITTLSHDAMRKNFEQHLGEIEQYVLTVFSQVMLFCHPSRFVIEELPPRIRPKDAPKIPRSHERLKYTLLTPLEIHKRYGAGLAEDHEKGTTKASHWRRRHVRTLRSDHWVNKQGQTIIVKATWIGPDEFQGGNGRKYKVRLDL